MISLYQRFLNLVVFRREFMRCESMELDEHSCNFCIRISSELADEITQIVQSLDTNRSVWGRIVLSDAVAQAKEMLQKTEGGSK